MDLSCRYCRFWLPLQARDPADPTRVVMVSEHEKATIGQCRRWAPRPGTQTVMGEWPKTNSVDWCGEWAARS